MKEMRIIVAGSRDFKNYDLLFEKLMDYLQYADPNQIKFIDMSRTHVTLVM